jgi:hypothetical protein
MAFCEPSTRCELRDAASANGCACPTLAAACVQQVRGQDRSHDVRRRVGLLGPPGDEARQPLQKARKLSTAVVQTPQGRT